MIHRAFKRTGLIGWLLLAAAALALAAGCASEEPQPLDQPPAVDEAQLRREAEERAQREAEERRLAEERRIAEEKRQQEELQEAFGQVGEPPPLAPPPAPKVEGIPFDEAVPPLPPEPTVRVAVFSHASQPDKGRRVALIIGTYEREVLEERLGMAVRIAYVAAVKHSPPHDSEIRYRPPFLRAAQSVAAVLPAEQWVGPMTEQELRQEGVDLVVYVGEAYR